MGKILMVYASQTGNTEQVTDIIAHYLQELGHEITIKSFDFDVIDVDTLENYAAILVGTHTWDDGELPYEVEDFYIDLEDTDITEMIFGVYGSADSFYDTFGGAIDLVWDHVMHLGATVLEETLKIDLEPNRDDEKRCANFAAKVSETIASRNERIA